MNKEKLISESTIDDTLEQQWKMRFDDVYYTDRNGRKRKDLSASVEALFLAHNLQEFEEHTETHITLHCTVASDKNKFAHMSLVGLLDWQSPIGEAIDWRSVANRPKAVPGIEDFAQCVNDALQEEIVTHIFLMQPKTSPSFLNAG